MGVIGRLDDQVNEIIIKPVGERRGARESEATQSPAPATTSQHQPSASEDGTQTKENREAPSSELPVWLL